MLYLRWSTLLIITAFIFSFYPSESMAGPEQHNCSCSSGGDVEPLHRAVTNKNITYNMNSKHNPSEFDDVCLLINTFNLTLTVFCKGEPIRKYPVAAGKPGSETPAGVWKVVNKSDAPASGTGTRWMGLNVPWGSYGVHGTSNPPSIGSYASKGCIRLHNAHVEEIYPWVNYNTWVIIVGDPFGFFGENHPLLREGSFGPAVREVQHVLKRLGFYEGETDGMFGPGTAKAVSDFRKKNGLPEGSQVNGETYNLLGL